MRRIILSLIPVCMIAALMGAVTGSGIAVAHSQSHHARKHHARPKRLHAKADPSVGELLHAPSVKGHVKSYQWRRCNTKAADCSNIKGATHSTYRIIKADVGHRLLVKMIVAASSGTTTVSSAPTAVVTAAPVPAPVNLTIPVISINNSVAGCSAICPGDVLTTSNGTWTGAVSFTYQWQDCAGATCTNISGATSQTYTVQTSDVGDSIDVVVTAYNSASVPAIRRAASVL